MEATQTAATRTAQSAGPTSQTAPTTVDLENKIMSVGDRHYYIDMKQHGDSRFFSIMDASEKVRRSRVVVPMLAAGEFLEKINLVAKFVETYVPSNASGSQSTRNEPMKFAFTTTLFTPAKRRYYFDVMDADDEMSLRISYVFADRRDSIVLVCDCLPNLKKVIEEFAEKYPSISPTDDYSLRRRGGGRMNGRQNRRGRGFRRGFDREGRSPRRGNFRGDYKPRERSENQRDKPENSEPRKIQSLKVCADPAPMEFTNNAKKYQLEIVEGSNTFMRITEMINDSRKSTLHVPMECLVQLQSILNEMGSRFTITKGGPQGGQQGPKP